MNSTVPKEVLEKLRRCLALGENKSAFANEAATALRMAETIMREYGLSRADVEMEAGHVKEASFKSSCGYGARDLWPWEKTLGFVMENLLPVKYYTQDMQQVMFVGAESDANMAAAFYGILRKELLQLSRGEPTPAFRRSFLVGCVRVLVQRSQEMKRAREAKPIAEQADASHALVVVKEQDLKAYVAKNLNLHKTYGRGSSLYDGSYQRGQAAGRSVNLSFGRALR